jgi:hypothetical protein
MGEILLSVLVGFLALMLFAVIVYGFARLMNFIEEHNFGWVAGVVIFLIVAYMFGKVILDAITK